MFVLASVYFCVRTCFCVCSCVCVVVCVSVCVSVGGGIVCAKDLIKLTCVCVC